MDGPRACHTKQDKSEKERQILYDITYLQNLKYDKNEQIYKTKTFTDVDNRLLIAKGEASGGRDYWKFEVDRYKLLYIGWIKQQGSTVQHREQYLLSCDKP